MKRKITKKHIFTKTLFQILLYALEIVLIAGSLTFLSYKFVNNDEINIIDILDRFTIFYGIYQLLVFVIFNNINDIKADEYLALCSTCECAILACETNDSRLIRQVNENIKKQLNGDVFNDIEVRNIYNEIPNYIRDKNVNQLKFISIYSNHQAELSKLNWRFSFLLRIFKKGEKQKCPTST